MKTRLASTGVLAGMLSLGCGGDSTDPTTSSPFSVATVWAATRMNGEALPYDWVMSLLDGGGMVTGSITLRFHALEFRLGADLATCEVYQRVEVLDGGVDEGVTSCGATYESGILNIDGLASSGLTVPSGSTLDGMLRGGGTTAASFTLQVPAYEDAAMIQPALSIVFTKQ